MSTDVHIDVHTQYLPEHSKPRLQRNAFAYTITISNRGDEGFTLLGRHWVITDGNNHVEEVRGEGVVGEQPHIRPGESFRYTSGAVLATAVGTMQGEYQMLSDNGEHFDVPIPAFSLVNKAALH